VTHPQRLNDALAGLSVDVRHTSVQRARVAGLSREQFPRLTELLAAVQPLARDDPDLLLMLDLKGVALQASVLRSVLAEVARHGLQAHVAVWWAPSRTRHAASAHTACHDDNLQTATPAQAAQ
jgi:hypothetical protein